jgi:hypothetical protein
MQLSSGFITRHEKVVCCVHAAGGDKRRAMRAGGVLWEGMGWAGDLARLRLVRGLSNDSGLNNCFLNVVIQALWHLPPFRAALLALRPQVGRACSGASPAAFHCPNARLISLPGSKHIASECHSALLIYCLVQAGSLLAVRQRCTCMLSR